MRRFLAKIKVDVITEDDLKERSAKKSGWKIIDEILETEAGANSLAVTATVVLGKETGRLTFIVSDTLDSDTEVPEDVEKLLSGELLNGSWMVDVSHDVLYQTKRGDIERPERLFKLFPNKRHLVRWMYS